MKILSFLFLSFSFVSILTSCSEAPPIDTNWVTDFEAASQEAKESGKYMLLNFTGSDWCGPCIKLKKDVFSKDEFKKYIHDEFIAVELDFPKGKELGDALIAQNERLAQKFDVEGFPTIILLSPEGEFVARTGYRPYSSKEYVEHLKGLIATYEKK